MCTTICTEWGITLSLYVREYVHNGLLYTLALYIIRVVGITEPCMDDCMQRVVDKILLCMYESMYIMANNTCLVYNKCGGYH